MTYAVSRPTKRKTPIRAFAGESAKAALDAAGFGKDREAFGFNKGQFSFIDLIEAAIAYTGPADVVVATWTAADADLRRVASQMEHQRVRSITWIVDYSFETRQPAFCATLRELFGDACIRTTASHAKFALISAGEWKIVVQTSMNLNQNKRIENFWIGDDPDLFAAYSDLVAEIFKVQANGEQFGHKPAKRRAEMSSMGKDTAADPFSGIGSVGTFGADLNTMDDF